MKPRVFIGSSSEGLDIAYALQSNLEADGVVTVWNQDVFKPSEFILESLLKELDATDVGVFVFSPDDTVIIRGVEQPAVRDNVIFEVGLYVGRLGRERSFIVSPRGQNPRLPSDLLGVSVANYDGSRTDGRLEAALGPASNKIRSALKALAQTIHPIPSELSAPIMERRGMLSIQQRELLERIEAKAPVTQDTLGPLFPHMARSELHYRLEQLRLLQFVIVLNPSDGETQPNVVTLHPLYEHARRGKGVLGTG